MAKKANAQTKRTIVITTEDDFQHALDIMERAIKKALVS
jgi:hypothetical protein